MFKWIQSSSNTSKQPSTSAAPTDPSPSSSAHPPNVATHDPSDKTNTAAQDGPDLKRFGMENFGNTCYANSVLQALYFCQPFRDLLIASHDHQPTASAAVSLPPPPPPTNSSTQPVTAATPGLAKRTPSTRAATVPASLPHKRNASLSAGGEDALQLLTSETAGSSQDTTTGPPIPANPATLYLALRSLFYHIANQSTSKGVVAPQAFVAKLKKENVLFRSSMHQDAHEFLNYLLNKVVEDLEEEGKNDILTKSVSSITSSTSTSTAPSATSLSASPPPPPPPLIQSLFQGTLTNETRCLTCENVTSRSEPFLDLSLDISQNTSVNACLRHFSKSEMLTARNKFFCDECCGLVEAEKRMKVKTLPPILLLHLKRFKYQEDLQKYVKLSYRVAFPLELRLYNNTVDPTDPSSSTPGGNGEARGRRRAAAAEPEQDRDREREVKGAGSGGPGDPEGLYRLFAVVVHIGGGPHHGHYVTLVKSPTTWLLFDDDSVEPIKESDIPKYFGDSAFTVEAAVNAAKDPVAPTSSAAATASTAAPVNQGITSAANATAMAMMGIGGPSVVPSAAKVLAANPPGSTGMKPGGVSSAGSAGSTNPPPPQPGSGYVLFYQAADLDLKGLGLISAAKEAKEVGTTMLAASASKVSEETKVPEDPTATVTHAQIFVEEPEEDHRLGLGPPTASPNFTATSSSPASVTAPLHPVPASPSGMTATTSDSSGGDQTTQPLSLDIPPLSPASLAPLVAGIEDQLSPLALPPPHGNGHSSGGGFFKSLKHSASVNVGSMARPKESGSGLAAGFGLGMSGPSKHAVVAGSSSPALLDVKDRSASHPLPLKEKEKVAHKEKEKEKEGGSGNWFSRKSVRRKSKAKDKDREKDEREKDLHGTSSVGSSVTSRSDVPPPLPLTSTKRPPLPIPPPSATEANGSLGDEPPLLPPVPIKSFVDDRRASEPAASVPTSLAPAPPEFPRKFSGDDTTLRIPHSKSLTPSPPSAFTPGSVPSSPIRNGRFAPPRKSLTLLDSIDSSPSNSFAIGLSPIPRTDGTISGGGLMKRASRKMSLNSSSLRLSGFGWNKDRDRHAS